MSKVVTLNEDELLSFLGLYDIIDGWYHEQTRHHLADIDVDVAKNMFDPLMAAIDQDREQAVVEARITELKSLKLKPGRFTTTGYGLWVDEMIDKRISALQSKAKGTE